MSAQRARPKRASAPIEPRKTELIGLTEDGRKVLWSTGMVRPVSTFETSAGGKWIKSGHYVIDWKGHAITVHCGNVADGTVSVQFMCMGLSSISMSRREIEGLLLGLVVPDVIAQAKITEQMRQLARDTQASQDVPHRQRGRI